ncbi:MAG: ABC transporter permease [Verrucomicrobiota bacterium]
MIEFFQSLIRYRGVLFYRTIASLRADARRLYLGYIWWILEPVLNTALYFFVFAVILETRTEDFIGYLLLGTTVYQWFQSSVVGTMGTILERAQLYRQIPLPKYLFSLISVFSSTWKFLCVFSIISAYAMFTSGSSVTWAFLWLPILVTIQLLLIFGLSVPLAIGSAYIRDLQTFMGLIFRAGMFLSAIFWDISKVPENLKLVFFANPLASMIQAFRSVILDGTAPNLYHITYVLILGLLLIQVGMVWHRKIDLHILKHVES